MFHWNSRRLEKLECSNNCTLPQQWTFIIIILHIMRIVELNVGAKCRTK